MGLRRLAAQDRARAQAAKEQIRHAHRDPWQPREKAAVILWRKHGYSISHIAAVFHRSCSSIQGILKNAESLGVVLRRDYRKIPNQMRLRINAARRQIMGNHMRAWLAWIAGEGDKPP